MIITYLEEKQHKVDGECECQRNQLECVKVSRKHCLKKQMKDTHKKK